MKPPQNHTKNTKFKKIRRPEDRHAARGFDIERSLGEDICACGRLLVKGAHCCCGRTVGVAA